MKFMSVVAHFIRMNKSKILTVIGIFFILLYLLKWLNSILESINRMPYHLMGDLYTNLPKYNWQYWPEMLKDSFSSPASEIFLSFHPYVSGWGMFLFNGLSLFVLAWLLVHWISKIFSYEKVYGKSIYQFIVILFLFSIMHIINVVWFYWHLTFVSILVMLLGFYYLSQYIQEKEWKNIAISYVWIFISILVNPLNIVGLFIPMLVVFSMRYKALKMIFLVTFFVSIVIILKYQNVDVNTFFIHYLNALGGMFFDISAKEGISLSFIMGAFMLLSMIYAFYYFVSKEKNSYMIGLTSYLLFYVISMSALVLFDLQHDMAFLYPKAWISANMIAWLIVIIIFGFYIKTSIYYRDILVMMSIMSIAIFTLYQFRHFVPIYKYKELVLKMKLGFMPLDVLRQKFPYVEHDSIWRPLDKSFFQSMYVQQAMLKNRSVFGNKIMQDVSMEPTKNLKIPQHKLTAYVDLVEHKNNADMMTKLIGWSYDKKENRVPLKLYIVNDMGEIIGYAISGMVRNDVANIFGHKYRFSGFTGYAWKKNFSKPIYLIDDNMKNAKKIVLPIK